MTVRSNCLLGCEHVDGVRRNFFIQTNTVWKTEIRVMDPGRNATLVVHLSETQSQNGFFAAPLELQLLVPLGQNKHEAAKCRRMIMMLEEFNALVRELGKQAS